MKSYTVIVELEVEVLARTPRHVDRLLSEIRWQPVRRDGSQAPGSVRVERVVRSSQYHHER